MKLGGIHSKSIAERRQSQLSASRTKSDSSRVNSEGGVSLWHIETRRNEDLGVRDELGRTGSAGSGEAFITVPQGYYEYGQEQEQEGEYTPLGTKPMRPWVAG